MEAAVLCSPCNARAACQARRAGVPAGMLLAHGVRQSGSGSARGCSLVAPWCRIGVFAVLRCRSSVCGCYVRASHCVSRRSTMRVMNDGSGSLVWASMAQQRCSSGTSSRRITHGWRPSDVWLQLATRRLGHVVGALRCNTAVTWHCRVGPSFLPDMKCLLHSGTPRVVAQARRAPRGTVRRPRPGAAHAAGWA